MQIKCSIFSNGQKKERKKEEWVSEPQDWCHIWVCLCSCTLVGCLEIFWVHCEVDMSDLKTWRFRFHSDAMSLFYCVTENTTSEHSIKLISLPLIWCSVCDMHQNTFIWVWSQFKVASNMNWIDQPKIETIVKRSFKGMSLSLNL